MLTRDQLIREYRNNAASWPAVVGVYGVIVATMIACGAAIV